MGASINWYKLDSFLEPFNKTHMQLKYYLNNLLYFIIIQFELTFINNFQLKYSWL